MFTVRYGLGLSTKHFVMNIKLVLVVIILYVIALKFVILLMTSLDL